MTRRGRRTSAGSIVERLKATAAAKERVLVILGNLGGTVPPSEASRRLQLSLAMFRRIRETMLKASLGALEPRPRGRPAREIPKHVRDARRLEVRVAELEEELELARVREEIALVLPWTRRSQKKTRRLRKRGPAGTPSGPPAA
jgi:hypothetical protein